MSSKTRLYFKDNGVNLRFILICLLLVSSFLPRTYLPYIIVTILAVFSFIYFRKSLSGKIFAYFLLALFGISIISWLLNFFIYHDIDFLGLAIWWLTNLFPFLIIILVATLNEDIDISKVTSFYRYILLVEFLLIVMKSVQRNIFYGDHARGTCFDAHVLAVHFTVGIVLTLSEIFINKDQKPGINFLYLYIFGVGLIMTSFKANIIFLFIVLILFFFYQLIRKIITYRKNFRKYRIILISFLLVCVIGLLVLTQTYLLGDIKTDSKLVTENIDDISTDYDTEDWHNLERWGGKIYSYSIAFFTLPKEMNVITGYGPSTYTSRAAQYRMLKISKYAEFILVERLGFSEKKAEEITSYLHPRVSKIYEKYLFKIRYTSTLNAPMASIISFWVETGVLGVGFLAFFFTYLFIRLKRTAVNDASSDKLFYRNDFLGLLLIIFILNLFYFNYWEYPEMVIPIMTFVILSITGKIKLQNN